MKRLLMVLMHPFRTLEELEFAEKQCAQLTDRLALAEAALKKARYENQLLYKELDRFPQK